jgi:transposase
MRTDERLWRNRKAKKELTRRLQSENPGLEVVHPHAAGIDVGNGAHYAAVRPDRDSQPVRRFECFTADLYRLADWFESCGVKTVALQSTGVYWIPLYDILEERGFEVYLVNARHTKNLPGRKSDVQESQWLLKLHTYGLLNNSFQPLSKIRTLRTYWRQRLQQVTGAATCVQRMQKALTQMNIQLANVISDLSGVTGQLIVRAIVAGERDSRKLAELSHPRIQASRAEIAKSLEGNWRQELIFVLQQELEMYDTYQRRVAECDQQLQMHLRAFSGTVPLPVKEELPPKKKKKQNKNNPHFHLADELERITGVDLTRIDGIDVIVAQTVISEVGLDMSPWKTEAHFASWLGLCPDNRISASRNPSRAQPRGHCLPSGSFNPAQKPNVPRCAIPALAQQARRSESHYRHGSSSRSARLSNVEVWPAVRRQRCRVLRTKKPPTTNRLSQKEGSQTRPTARTSYP